MILKVSICFKGLCHGVRCGKFNYILDHIYYQDSEKEIIIVFYHNTHYLVAKEVEK